MPEHTPHSHGSPSPDPPSDVTTKDIAEALEAAGICARVHDSTIHRYFAVEVKGRYVEGDAGASRQEKGDPS